MGEEGSERRGIVLRQNSPTKISALVCVGDRKHAGGSGRYLCRATAFASSRDCRNLLQDKGHAPVRSTVSLCISCNRPAEEFDAYEALTAHLMSQIAAGVSIIRSISTGNESQKGSAINSAAIWVVDAARLIGEATDYREMIADIDSRSIHAQCAAWKITYRRVNALAVDIDFMRRDLIGHFVPGFQR
jgi:hypothetical protein